MMNGSLHPNDDAKSPTTDTQKEGRIRYSSSLSSKHDNTESESFLEPDLDYEPDESSFNDDDIDIFGNKNRFKQEREFMNESRDSISSDDDIEVIDILNSRCNQSQVSVINSPEFNRPTSRTLSSPSNRENRKDLDKESNSESQPSSSSFVQSPQDISTVQERKYSRNDLEKVKAYFNGFTSLKRKDSESIGNLSKRFKHDYGQERRVSKEHILKDKLTREGKTFISNYIPHPSSRKSDFKADIKKAFKEELNDDILSTLTPLYCGLCFKDFEDDDIAWKHYTGSSHKSIIKRFNRGTYKGHPPYWKMVHERLCTSYPNYMSEREIYEHIRAVYNVDSNNLEKVREHVARNLDYLVQYKQVEKREQGYLVINKNTKEVGKIFENYFVDKRRSEEINIQKSSRFEEITFRRRYEEQTSRYRSDKHYTPEPRRTERNSRSNLSERKHINFRNDHKSQSSNSEDRMLVVDPSNLRMLPNGQIMIKTDSVVSMRKP